MSDIVISALMFGLLVASQAHGEEILPPCEYLVNPKPSPRYNENCFGTSLQNFPKPSVSPKEDVQDLEIL